MPKRLALLAAAAPAVALAAAGVISPLRMAVETRAAAPGGEAAYLRALEPLRGELGEEPIGFLGERPLDVTQGGPVELYYYLAQYALAPLLVEPRPARPVVLAVDPRPGRLEALRAEPHVETLRDLGPGLALLRVRPRAP